MLSYFVTTSSVLHDKIFLIRISCFHMLKCPCFPFRGVTFSSLFLPMELSHLISSHFIFAISLLRSCIDSNTLRICFVPVFGACSTCNPDLECQRNKRNQHFI